MPWRTDIVLPWQVGCARVRLDHGHTTCDRRTYVPTQLQRVRKPKRPCPQLIRGVRNVARRQLHSACTVLPSFAARDDARFKAIGFGGESTHLV